MGQQENVSHLSLVSTSPRQRWKGKSASPGAVIAGIISRMEALRDLLVRSRVKFQGAPEQLVREHANYFAHALQATLALVGEKNSSPLPLGQAMQEIKKLHAALVSLRAHPPEGSWFEENRRHLEDARHMIENGCRALPDLHQCLVARAHLHRPESTKISQKRLRFFSV